MSGFIKFMASTAGRVLRVVAGLAIIAWGILGMDGTSGYIVAGIGVIPILTGVVDICAFAPLFGMPLNGAKTRAGDA